MRTSVRGFTLIELSLVLVIISLLVGGILLGRDMVANASIRAQISQIEKIRVAANTFKIKFGGLPGDIAKASALGFTSRPGTSGQGDGNGIIEGYDTIAWTGNYPGTMQGGGEMALFWIDLTGANGKNVNMIDGNFKKNGTGGWDFIGYDNVAGWFPTAKLGANNLYVYSWNGTNYIGMSRVYQLSSIYVMGTHASLTPIQAFMVDSKADDGLPQSGTITSRYCNWDGFDLTVNYPRYAMGGWNLGALNFSGYQPDDTTATAPSSTTCFDNNNVGGGPQQYSRTPLSSGNLNCALSFQM